MILCDAEIRAALRHGDLVIKPSPPPDRIGTSAIDLTLAKGFRRWKRTQGGGASLTIDPAAADFDYTDLAARFQEDAPLESDGSVRIAPNELILALTQERVELPVSSRLAARVEGRSTLARLGLGIHLTAPTIHAGFRGRITLEITNHGPLDLKPRPGLVICQLILEQVFGTPSTEMVGIFQDQDSVAGRVPPSDSGE